MKSTFFLSQLLIISLLFASCSFVGEQEVGQSEKEIDVNKSTEQRDGNPQAPKKNKEDMSLQAKKDPMVNKKQIRENENIDTSLYEREPNEWGENVTGVKTSFKTDKKELALTFDACGGEYGSDFDDNLINFLNEEQIPATLFINSRWIKENEDLFLQLANNPLFQIENHGTEHAPLSVNGGEAWGIAATASAQEVVDEIMNNHDIVRSLTGNEMTLFRSGTAYYDEVAVELAEALGYQVVNFDILGDAGATYTADQVKNALLQAEPGSIALLHMNQPSSGTSEGVMRAVPLLREQGYEFVLLKGKTLQ